MEKIKPKKERKFLNAMGDIALTLFRELVLGIGKKVINKVGNKRQGLVIAFALVAGISYASIDSIPYPITSNKQRLGWQTSGNGLVYRGRSADTITKPSSYVDKNVKAYLLVDSVLGTIFVWRQTYWDSIKVNTRLMPFDSITFNTAKNGTVGVGEVEYNDTQGSLIQGLKGGNVTNVIGQQLHQRVNNRTGAPLAKGDVVYLAGSQGNRITVAKGLAVTDAFSANTFGVVAESIPDNQSGFIITEGLITGLNTSALTEDSAVYLSPTVAGALTSTKPQAPQHTVYIGVCVKSSNGSGELFVKIRNGQELDELHDTRITNPVTGATLYFLGGLWRDTTAALLVSDTASMLTPYLRKADTASISNRINLKVNISDTLNMLVPYLRKADTTNMLLPYFRDADTTSLNLTSRFATKLNLSDTASMLTNYLRTGVAANTYLPLTGGTLTGGLTGISLNLSSTLNSTGDIFFGSNSSYSGLKTRYFKTTDISPNRDLFIGSVGTIGTWAGRMHFQTSYNTEVPTTAMTINEFGNINMNGTLGVTGATTLGSTLAVTGDITENGNNVLTSADTSAFASDNQISGTTGQVAYFNSSNSVISNAGLIYNATNKLLGINTTTTSGANLIIKNSQEPSRATVVTTQTFAADTINWTSGTGWTFNGTQAVATAATGNLTYTPALTITSGNAYEIRYTLTNYSAGTLTIAFGNGSYLLPTHNVTSNFILILPTTATGGFRFTTSSFTGNIDDVSVVEISGEAPILFAGQDDGSATLYNSLRMPNSTTLSFGNGGARTTGSGNNFIGNNTGRTNTTGSGNNFIGNNTGISNTIGSGNNFFGTSVGQLSTIGNNNNFFGNSAGQLSTTGNNNNFFGNIAGRNNITGNNNNFFGSQAGTNNTTGDANNFFGQNSGLNNTTGGSNNFFGTQAGQSNKTGGSNNFFGFNAGRSNITGNFNVAIGDQALFNSTSGDTLTGSNNIAIGSNAADNIRFAAAGNVAIGNAVDLPVQNGSNQGVYQNVLFFTGASGTGTTIAAASKAGIKTNAPNRDLEVAGEVRITDLTTDTPTRLVGADADGDLGQVTLGSTLSLTGSSLGVTSNTFLPLTGGTLTGGLTGTTGTFTGLNVSNTTTEAILNLRSVDFNNASKISFGDGSIARQEIIKPTSTSNLQFRSYPTSSASGGYDFYVSNGSLESLAATIGTDKSLSLTGTLGVTGATTLSAPLTVNSSAVFNEGSADADFRVESDGNANMVFVDASTDRVGIGYASPTKTLDVNGTFGVFGESTFSNKIILNDSSRFEGNVLFKKNMGLPIVKISNADYTATTANHTIIYTTLTSDKTLTIPNAADAVGIKYTISIFDEPEGNEALTLVTPSSNLFVRTDGENSSVDIVGGFCTVIQSDGIKWYILSYSPMY